jgi:hypothetical protein
MAGDTQGRKEGAGNKPPRRERRGESLGKGSDRGATVRYGATTCQRLQGEKGHVPRAMREALYGDAGFVQSSASTKTLLFMGIQRLLRDCLIVPAYRTWAGQNALAENRGERIGGRIIDGGGGCLLLLSIAVVAVQHR